jgi:glycosyltransferase involved in cell wall biosynthesis
VLIATDLKHNYKYGTGIANHFKSLLYRLVRIDAENEYVFLSPRGYRIPEITTSHTRYVDVPYPQGLGRASHVLYDQVVFPFYLRRERPDVFLSPYFDIPLFGTLPPLVVSILDLSLLELRHLYPRLFWRYYRTCLDAAVARARHVLTISDYSRGRLVDLLGVNPETVTVLRPTIDPQFRRLEDRAAVGARAAVLGASMPYVLYSGGVDPRKNLPVLFAAFAQARAALREPVQLICVGDRRKYDPYRTLLRELRLAPPSVHFPGRVSTEDLVVLYNGARAGVYPSLYEGFGYPVAEAMACGAPVVCSNTTCLPEVGGDAPLYFDPLSPEELTRQLTRVLSDRDLGERRSERGLVLARSFYENDSAQRLLAVLTSL